MNASLIVFEHSIELNAGEAKNIDVTFETRKDGPGKVSYTILRLKGYPIEYTSDGGIPAANRLPLPQGMEVSIDPSSFMGYPANTYKATLTIKTSQELSVGEYLLFLDHDFENAGSGGGEIKVKVNPPSTPSTTMLEPVGSWQVNEKLIFTNPGTPGDQRYNISPDGRQIAYVTEKSNQEVVVINGVESKAYERIARGEYGEVIVFSPDSRHTAFRALMQGKWLVVRDGIEDQPYAAVDAPDFSPDSQRLAYKAYTGDQERHDNDMKFMVADGIEGAQYDDILDCVFSPDSQKLAYVAKKGNGWCMVVNGIEGKQYDHISQITFSPDSQRLAYIAITDNLKRLSVINGIESKLYDGSTSEPTFSPDSRRFAYIAGYTFDTLPQFVVVDGVEGQQCFAVSDLVFSPDSKRIGYLAVTEDRKEFVVVDGVEGQHYDGIGTPLFPLFSPDSQRFAYHAVGADDIRSIVIDGVEGKKYSMTGLPIFSPDSQRVAYRADAGDSMAMVDTKQLMVVDGIEGKQYGVVWDPIFSPDGQKIVYIASKGNPFASIRTREFVVIDGVESKPYDDIFLIIFDSPSSFHYVAREGDNFYLVENRMK
jgi:Tol biopolymer transport system component